MKNDSIIAPIYMPAELRPEEFANYFSAIAGWVRQHPKALESLFQDYRSETKSEDSPPARMWFNSFLFFECEAGLDFLRTLRRNRLGQSAFVGNHATPATSAN